MKEITSKRTKVTQFITDDEWQWLKDNGKAKNFTMKEMTIIKRPVINKDVLLPELKKHTKKQ